ncbi:hypothetical protein JEZ13_08875 [bacterium]|nr:hypothetical protein [bacterium]
MSILKNMATYGFVKRRKSQQKNGYTNVLKRILKSKPVDNSLFNKEIEQQYINKWKAIEKNPSLDYFKIYSTFNNKVDLNYVPDYLYEFPIKNILLDQRYSHYNNDKNLYEKRLIDFSHLFPKVIFRRISGVFYDNNYNYINNIHKFIESISHQIIVIKESTDSAGGKGVKFFNRVDANHLYETKDGYTINQELSNKKDIVVQEKLIQSLEMSKINKSSINSVRVVTYRSVSDNKVHVIQALLRRGGADSFLDNWHSGGSIIAIKGDGQIADFGYNENFEQVYHGVKNFIIPKLNEMYALAIEIAKSEFYHRQISFDFFLDLEDNVKIIEINYSVSPVVQIICGPVFAEYTDEVIEYCQKNMGYYNFNIPVSLKYFK